MATITPGSRITLTVIKPPTNRGAEKTIKRLLEKDKAAMKDSCVIENTSCSRSKK